MGLTSILAHAGSHNFDIVGVVFHVITEPDHLLQATIVGVLAVLGCRSFAMRVRALVRNV